MASQPISKLILDTDPGGDDIFAFLWMASLVRQGLAELIAVTAVEGNVAALKTFSSSSQVLGLVELAEVEVGRGVQRPTRQENATHIHGPDGMGNLSTTLPAATHAYESARPADEIICDRLNAAPGEITLVGIGPLTNLAAAETKHPGILRQAKQVVVMAGAFQCQGNVTPAAEFNVWFNPEAAQTVFNSRDDIVVLPLDVTRSLIFTREMAEVVAAANPASPIAQFLVALCKFMIGTALQYRETRGVPGFLVHDAATLGYLFYPETLMLRRAKVRVETQGEWTCGQTLIDDRPLPKTDFNAWVALEVDAVGFFTRFVEDLKSLVRSNA